MSTQFRGANKTGSANFTIATAAGNIGGNGEFGAADRHYQISISHSVLNLAQIHYLSARGYAMAGTLGIDAQGQGTLKAPELNVALAGDQLAFRGTALGSMNADLHVANQLASFKLDSNIAGGQVHADGNAALAAPYMMEGAFEIRPLQFGPLLATYLPGAQRPFQGNAEVRGSISGPLVRPEEMNASVEVSTLNLAYQEFSLASAGPVRVKYADRILTISQAELKGTDRFQVCGKIAPAKRHAAGNIDKWIDRPSVTHDSRLRHAIFRNGENQCHSQGLAETAATGRQRRIIEVFIY